MKGVTMKHILNIAIEEEQYEALRKLAYDSRKSIAEIMRSMIDKLLKEGR